MNLNKEMRDCYNENRITVKKEIEDDIRKWNVFLDR